MGSIAVSVNSLPGLRQLILRLKILFLKAQFSLSREVKLFFFLTKIAVTQNAFLYEDEFWPNITLLQKKKIYTEENSCGIL